MAGSIALTDSYTSATNATSYTGTGLSLGATASDRVIIVGVESRIATTSGDISSVTVAGNSATLIRKELNTLDGSSTNVTAVYAVALATGTTGDVVVTFPGMMLRCGFQVYRAVGTSGTTAHATAANSVTSGNASTTIDIPAGGVLLAIGINAANTTVTWTGPTEDVDVVVESNTTLSSASGNYATLQTGYTVTYQPASSTGGPTLVAVSWAPAASTTYTLTASAGTFSLSGQAAGLLVSRRLTCSAGTFSLSGQSASLNKVSRVAADAGVFLLSGQTANLLANRSLTAANGTFTLTGQDADFALGKRILADVGTFSLSGQDATFLLNRVLASEFGEFTLSGQVASLLYNKSLTAEVGSFTLSGQDVNFLRSKTLIAEAGTFTLSGQDATLTRSLLLSGGVGTFTLSGQNVTFTLVPVGQGAAVFSTLSFYPAVTYKFQLYP